METNALVLSGFGLNTEHETKYCIEKVGGKAKIVHVNRLVEKRKMLEDFNFLVIPGGSSFGDALGPGKALATKIRYKLGDSLTEFINQKKLILGISNGFQVLVKMGILPNTNLKQEVTLTTNQNGEYINRWMSFKINKNSPCIFTKDISYMTLPVRNYSSKFYCNQDVLEKLMKENLHALQYIDKAKKIVSEPSGSRNGIAGLCDKTGRVFGMVPLPDSFGFVENCPNWVFGIKNAQGLLIFKNAVDYLKRQE